MASSLHPRLLDLPLHADTRGELQSIEFGDISFEVKRAFVVRGADGAIRGEHSHHTCSQILMVASGEVEVELVEAGETRSVVLSPDCPAVLIPAGVWSRQTYRGPSSALVVFCDEPYDPASYRDQAR